MKFKHKIKEKLKDVLNEEELSLLPRGFQTLGSIIIIKLNPLLLAKKKIIAEGYLDLLPKIRGVYLNSGKIVGPFRKPEAIEFLSGEDDPIVTHKENNVIYRFDINKIMFSKGNLNERRYLPTLVKPGEIIVDMFAGIGYFSLQIAKNSQVEKIYCIEFNPEAYRFLLENIKLNHLEEIILPIHGNCKEEVLQLSTSGIRADRIIMGIFPAPFPYVQVALAVSKIKGSVIHFEGVVEKDAYYSLFEDFKKIAEQEGYKSELKSYRFVKSYGPNLFHTVLDINVEKN